MSYNDEPLPDIMNKKRMKQLFILLAIFSIATAIPADEIPQTIQVSPSAVAGIDYLIEFIKPSFKAEFDPSRLADLINFISTAKSAGTRCQLPQRLNATPAYHEFEINRNFKDILHLAYHPDIPSQIISPGSMRFSYWTHINGANGSLPMLWEQTRNLSKPVVVKGVEAEELTPDTFSGAYYRSLLDRALILFSNKGHRILISLTKQKKASDVGKKGLILGTDDQWNYFYSGDKGLTKSGLGWADSYIYDTFSVLVYYETETDKPLTKCCIFKWLRAGWLGINMVKEKHIQSGFGRFVRDMKRVVESPRLPKAEKLAEISRKISHLSRETLQAKMGQYLKQLVTRQIAQEKKPHPWIKKAASGDSYLSRLSPPQIQATLFLEVLKFKLGLLTQEEVAYLVPLL